MFLSYDILKENIEKLEKIKSEYPSFSDFCKNQQSRSYSMTVELTSSGFGQFITFNDILDKYKDQDLILEGKIKFKDLKSKILESIPRNYPSEIRNAKIIGNKSKSKFDLLFTNYRLFHRYEPQLRKQSVLIINYLIKNSIPYDQKYHGFFDIFQYYSKPLPDLNTFQVKEIEISNKILSEIDNLLDKVKEQYDWRKVNQTFLNRKINDLISRKMLSLKNGDKVKLLVEPSEYSELSMQSLTKSELYKIINCRVGYESCLYITIIDDKNRQIEIPYKYFDEVVKMRDNKIDELFS